MYVLARKYLSLCKHLCMYACMYVCVRACVCVCTWAIVETTFSSIITIMMMIVDIYKNGERKGTTND